MWERQTANLPGADIVFGNQTILADTFFLRGAYVLGVTSYGNHAMEDTADFTIYVPKTMECFATSLVVIPLQLLAYYIASEWI